MDTIYEYDGESMPLLLHLQVALHVLLCPDCAGKVSKFEECRKMLSSDFLPPSPNLEESIMSLIAAEESETQEIFATEPQAGLSTRTWVIAGIIILVSLVSAFFCFDFNILAISHGMAFLLPIGITIGIILTSYGALFIGSHLKELSKRFGIDNR